MEDLKPQHIPKLADMLARAFDNDPGYGALFDASTRSKVLTFLMDRLLRMRLEAGTTVWVALDGERPVGTISFAPNTVSFGVRTYLRHGLLKLPLIAGFRPVRAMLQADEEVGALRKQLAPSAPYMWFAQLAVAPDHRDPTLALKLGVRALQKVDEERLPAATMTTDPRLLPLYRRFGFESVGQTTVNGFTTWMLVREAR